MTERSRQRSVTRQSAGAREEPVMVVCIVLEIRNFPRWRKPREGARKNIVFENSVRHHLKLVNVLKSNLSVHYHHNKEDKVGEEDPEI